MVRGQTSCLYCSLFHETSFLGVDPADPAFMTRFCPSRCHRSNAIQDPACCVSNFAVGANVILSGCGESSPGIVTPTERKVRSGPRDIEETCHAIRDAQVASQ